MYKKKHLSFINSFEEKLRKKTTLTPNKKITLGVSGGQDSICLLYLFFLLEIQWKFSLQLSYCNHLWQIDSFHTMRELIKFCFVLKFPLNCILSSKNVSTETEARNWRYQSLKRLLFFYTSTSLVTGHTGSDKIETILFNLLKGSGVRGISPLDWEKKTIYIQTVPQKYCNIFLLKKKFIKKNNPFLFDDKKKKLIIKEILKNKQKTINKINQKNHRLAFLNNNELHLIVKKRDKKNSYQPYKKTKKKYSTNSSKYRKWITSFTYF